MMGIDNIKENIMVWYTDETTNKKKDNKWYQKYYGPHADSEPITKGIASLSSTCSINYQEPQ